MLPNPKKPNAVELFPNPEEFPNPVEVFPNTVYTVLPNSEVLLFEVLPKALPNVFLNPELGFDVCPNRAKPTQHRTKIDLVGRSWSKL